MTVETCPYAPADLDRLLALEPELVACPFPLYDALREQAPVTRSDMLGAFVVSRHDDVVEVLRDTAAFSSAMASGPSSVTGLAKKILADPDAPAFLKAQAERRLRLAESPVLLFTDPPLHKRQRQLVGAGFHPRRVKQLEPDVRRLCEELVASFGPAGEVEIVSRFSIHLPMTVIATLLGVPPENMGVFKRWSNAFTSGVGALEHSSDDVAEIFEAVDGFYDYFTEQVERRRAEPQDDLLTDLVSARMDGEEPLTLDEILNMLVQFLVAGNETTTNTLTTLCLLLATDQNLQSRVRADLSLVKPLVEEVLRTQAPVQGMFRVAVKDTIVGGVDIPSGSMVWLVYGSANRDAQIFDDPNRIDLDSERPPHLSFARGEHFCLGANIAKLELQVALEVLLSRLDDIRLACAPEDVKYHRSFILRGIASLPITFTART
ncbi:MAG: cytochrome P450 [Candidatus Dormibacteria bacterium]